MNRRRWMMLSGAGVAAVGSSTQAQQANSPSDADQDTPDKFLLKDYRPESIYRVPKTEVKKARFPVVDAHCHGVRPPQQVDDMVKLMDASGVEKTVIFTGAPTAERFSQVRQTYAKYPSRFALWCSFDLTGVNQPSFGPGAVSALEECHRLGAVGVGEGQDYGRYLYEKEKSDRAAKKKQKVITVKECKFSVTVDDHDYQTKKNQAVRFLTEGDKVKASLRFRGRQMAHRELGYAIINRLIQDIGDAGVVEFMPRMEGTILHAIIAPAKKQDAPKPKPPVPPPPAPPAPKA